MAMAIDSRHRTFDIYPDSFKYTIFLNLSKKELIKRVYFIGDNLIIVKDKELKKNIYVGNSRILSQYLKLVITHSEMNTGYTEFKSDSDYEIWLKIQQKKNGNSNY